MTHFNTYVRRGDNYPALASAADGGLDGEKRHDAERMEGITGRGQSRYGGEVVKRIYSGNGSRRFWARIRKVPTQYGGDKLYAMGCILQDVESRVLRELEESESKLERESRAGEKG